MEESGELPSFDPKCTLFVCNKWDVVQKEGKEVETKVWTDTILKLTQQYPNLEQTHILKMSTTEVVIYLSNLTFC